MSVKIGQRLWVPEPKTDEDGNPILNDKEEPVMASPIEMLVIKQGDCNLFYDDKEMEVMQPKVLPSAD